MSAPLIFDKDHYLSLNSSRAKTLGDLLSQFRTQLNLQTAIDIGCGVGFFSEFLRSNGLRVKGVDGRGENIQEARSRHPGIDFTAGDAENLPTEQMGKFDLVLCFGLLYHLENPFRAIRSLERLTEKVLFVEGMCIPGDQAVMELLEEPTSEDQGFHNVAFYPTEKCLIKMLHRAGFPFVYCLEKLPDDERYRTTLLRERLRCFLAASKLPLSSTNLKLVEDSTRFAYEFESWATRVARLRDSTGPVGRLLVNAFVRVPRFLRRPWEEKREIMSWYLRRIWNRNSVDGTKGT